MSKMIYFQQLFKQLIFLWLRNTTLGHILITDTVQDHLSKLTP